MPDITMCAGGGCPRRETCYRHTAEPSPFRQSYFGAPPIEGGECRYYWPVQPDRPADTSTAATAQDGRASSEAPVAQEGNA